MLTFADLKKYKYYYWCCFPALLIKGWQVEGEWAGMDHFSPDEVSKTGVRAIARWRTGPFGPLAFQRVI